MLILNFEGWFQMRMATDPDPTDELRGVSGYTFAFAGEPDLDAKIHLQPNEPGVFEREFGPPGTPGPRVGVTVRSATRNGAPAPELHGTRIAFVDARILELNGLLVRNDYFIIDPLRVRLTPADLSDDRVLLEREDLFDLKKPKLPPYLATAAMLERRQPAFFTSNSQEVANATGLDDPSDESLMKNRLERRKKLEELRDMTDDPVKRAALTSRIEQLEIVEQWWNLSEGDPGKRPIDRRAAQLALQLSGYNIGLNGPVDPKKNTLGANPDVPWNISFWMGGWDGDALCAYVKGTWSVPLK
ncbi:MAG: hypothetical protein M3Q69_19170 [Acidobacteriota bacterium]|nr:hypothetical protein [Acidobacteriota bacterium]